MYRDCCFAQQVWSSRQGDLEPGYGAPFSVPLKFGGTVMSDDRNIKFVCLYFICVPRCLQDVSLCPSQRRASSGGAQRPGFSPRFACLAYAARRRGACIRLEIYLSRLSEWQARVQTLHTRAEMFRNAHNVHNLRLMHDCVIRSVSRHTESGRGSRIRRLL